MTFFDLLDLFSIEIIWLFHYFSIEIEKYSRNPQKAQIITKISICLEKSRSRLKSTGLANLIKTKSRNLDLDRDFSIVETNFLKLSRLILFWRRDRDLDRDHVETNRDPQPYSYDVLQNNVLFISVHNMV